MTFRDFLVGSVAGANLNLTEDRFDQIQMLLEDNLYDSVASLTELFSFYSKVQITSEEQTYKYK